MEKIDNDEVYISDLTTALKKKTNSFLGFFSIFIMKAFKFWYIFLLLIIIGGAIGYFIDKTLPDEYESTAIVRLNDKSSEYVYNNIVSLNDNFKDSIYIKHKFPVDAIETIGIEPISNFNDILVSYDDRNENILKYLLENASAEKILSSEFFRSEYYYHKLIITGTDSNIETLVSKIILELNDNNYYEDLNKQFIKNMQSRIKNAEYMVEQIDTSIARFNDVQKSYSENKFSSSGVQVVNNTLEINMLISSKISLLQMIENLKIELIRGKETVVLIDNPKTIKLPKGNILLFIVFGILFIYTIFLFVKTQSSKEKHS